MLGNAITDVNIDTPKERTLKIFGKMDTNNDGVLTKDEFTQGCMNDQCLYQMLTADTEGPKQLLNSSYVCWLILGGGVNQSSWWDEVIVICKGRNVRF